MMPAHARPGENTHVLADAAAAGAAAGAAAAVIIQRAVRRRGYARVIFACAPSQDGMLAGLLPRVELSLLEAFHMDEYLGLDTGDPHLFGNWLSDRLPPAACRAFHRIDPTGNPAAELARYAALVRRDTVDLACLGIGVNGHLAFNEPGCDLDDPTPMKVIDLDPGSRRQQVDDGLFTDLADVPTRALTLTIPTLLSAEHLVVTVLGERKSVAVQRALTAPITPDCPATALQRRPDAGIFLDAGAAAALGER